MEELILVQNPLDAVRDVRDRKVVLFPWLNHFRIFKILKTKGIVVLLGKCRI
jgi:hypothetical protein